MEQHPFRLKSILFIFVLMLIKLIDLIIAEFIRKLFRGRKRK